MPVRKICLNHSNSQNFFNLRCGIQRGKILKFKELWECWDNWEKLTASESGAQIKLIDAKKVYQKISWDYPFNSFVGDLLGCMTNSSPPTNSLLIILFPADSLQSWRGWQLNFFLRLRHSSERGGWWFLRCLDQLCQLYGWSEPVTLRSFQTENYFLHYILHKHSSLYCIKIILPPVHLL